MSVLLCGRRQSARRRSIFAQPLSSLLPRLHVLSYERVDLDDMAQQAVDETAQDKILKIDFVHPDRPLQKDSSTTSADLIVFNQGWKLEEDVPGKPGLIARNPRDKLIVFIPQILDWMFALADCVL